GQCAVDAGEVAKERAPRRQHAREAAPGKSAAMQRRQMTRELGAREAREWRVAGERAQRGDVTCIGGTRVRRAGGETRGEACERAGIVGGGARGHSPTACRQSTGRKRAIATLASS